MSLTLYFLRHGETENSFTDTFCGTLDPDLTPQGKEMATAFAGAYGSFDWSAIYVSPMRRTISTAQPLCEAIGVEMQLKDGLKEMNFGGWENQSRDWVKEHYLDEYINWMTEPAWNPPPDGETAVEVGSRAMLVISEIETKYPDGKVLVVSHKTTIRIILCHLLGIDLGLYRDRIDMLAASVSVIQFGLHGPMLKKLGDRSYMSQELQDRVGN
ncbi:histidine phosphatase family protein [Crocosphaera sp. Alani8]|uniref:histidine phosphatase family protein n=1 Tax=Crocosphaera sp. Alani8 TaxID=3038952 RepID=UPI00313BC76D